MTVPVTRKYIEDIAQGDYICPGRGEWFLVTGPTYLHHGLTADCRCVPAVDREGMPRTVALHWPTVETVEVAAGGVVPKPFTPRGLREAAEEIQGKLDELTVKRDRLLMFAEDQERK